MKEKRICIICNIEFECKTTSIKKTCSTLCSRKNSDNISDSYAKNPDIMLKRKLLRDKKNKFVNNLIKFYKTDSFPHERFSEFVKRVEK